jgi:hypothetical protein
MEIHISFLKPIRDNKTHAPEKMTFKGNYAIETMLIKVAEKYFGTAISRKIEDMLTNRIEDE